MTETEFHMNIDNLSQSHSLRFMVNGFDGF